MVVDIHLLGVEPDEIEYEESGVHGKDDAVDISQDIHDLILENYGYDIEGVSVDVSGVDE